MSDLAGRRLFELGTGPRLGQLVGDALDLAENRKQGGAIISIRLPLTETARELMIAKGSRRAEKRRERA